MKRSALILMIVFVSLMLLFVVSAEKGGNSDKGNENSNSNFSLNDKLDKSQEKDSGNSKIVSNIEIKQSEENGKTKMNAKLSNGETKEIKVMPDKASKMIRSILEDNFTVTLNEASEGEESKVIYSANSTEEVKILGIFKKKMKINLEIDAQTGNITKIKKQWWAFLASEKKITICHIPQGNPSDKHTIKVGIAALKAHINHRDFVGPCENNTNDDTNQTETNQTVNLTLTIISPTEINYTNNTILINIISNGEVIYSINNGSNQVYNESIFMNFENGTNELKATATKINENITDSLTNAVIFNVNPVMNITVQNQTETNQTNSTI